MATATKNAATSVNETLLSSWSEGLDRVFTAQTELEELVLQAIENQKESFGKLDGDIAKIQEEQKKLIEDIREQAKVNLQKTFGQAASKVFDQLNAQFDEISNQIQELSAKPYKKCIIFNYLSKRAIITQNRFTKYYFRQSVFMGNCIPFRNIEKF